MLILITQNGFLSIVFRAIIHNNELFFYPIYKTYISNTVKNSVDGWALVIGWYNNGQSLNILHNWPQSKIKQSNALQEILKEL